MCFNRQPIFVDCKYIDSLSVYIENRNGKSIPPCLTPLQMSKRSDKVTSQETLVQFFTLPFQQKRTV